MRRCEQNSGWNSTHIVDKTLWVVNNEIPTGREHVKTHICAVSVWHRKFSLIILWIPVNCPAIVIMLASDSMIAVLTTNTFVQVKVFSYLFFLDYLLMNKYSWSQVNKVCHALSICTWFLKNQVQRTEFLVYFEPDFYCLCSLQKSILKLIFAG